MFTIISNKANELSQSIAAVLEGLNTTHTLEGAIDVVERALSKRQIAQHGIGVQLNLADGAFAQGFCGLVG